MNERDFGSYHQRQLKAVLQRNRRRIPIDMQDAVAGVLKFLDERLNDAAKTWCHHCGEGEPGMPCWWCGLRNKKG